MNDIVLYTFDISSHLARIFKVEAPNDVIPNKPGSFFEGEPVFCLKPLRAIVENEIRRVERERNEKATHIAIIFDGFSKNFRYELFDGYKKDRAPKPPEWTRQDELAFQMFQHLGYFCLRTEGVESDDVLIFLSSVANKRGFTNVIFTGDKDIMSGVSENVHIHSGRERKTYNPEKVKEKLGVYPNKVIDLLAMMGDKGDGVNGILGVGKTKALQILENNTFDDVIKNPSLILDSNVSGGKSIVKWIEENKEEALLSKALVSLKKDLELGVNLKDMARKPNNYKSCNNDFFNRFLHTR